MKTILTILILTCAIFAQVQSQTKKVVIRSAKPVVKITDTVRIHDTLFIKTLDPSAITRATIDSVNKRLKNNEDAIVAFTGSFDAMTKALTAIKTNITTIMQDTSKTTWEFPLQMVKVLNDSYFKMLPWATGDGLEIIHTDSVNILRLKQ